MSECGFSCVVFDVLTVLTDVLNTLVIKTCSVSYPSPRRKLALVTAWAPLAQKRPLFSLLSPCLAFPHLPPPKSRHPLHFPLSPLHKPEKMQPTPQPQPPSNTCSFMFCIPLTTQLQELSSSLYHHHLKTRL